MIIWDLLGVDGAYLLDCLLDVDRQELRSFKAKERLRGSVTCYDSRETN